MSFFAIFSKYNIRVASLSMTNKNINDTLQRLPSSLTDIFRSPNLHAFLEEFIYVVCKITDE